MGHLLATNPRMAPRPPVELGPSSLIRGDSRGFTFTYGAHFGRNRQVRDPTGISSWPFTIYNLYQRLSESLKQYTVGFSRSLKESRDSPSEISCFKFAPITSVEVERSFSTMKNVFSDRRLTMTVHNIKKHLGVACNEGKSWKSESLAAYECLKSFLLMLYIRPAQTALVERGRSLGPGEPSKQLAGKLRRNDVCLL
ncbi:hypothetical protein ANN_13443 [Periplaneta americana]|uniref:HAT C-terminal dimerisation domain-containing protein n=1 Tax=Periplaneta americana TaxID=6978 RepID=A0ABQ8TLE8_PERAM|nr:hypothetical protein ANN_13443 [Periplaneta americana]